MLLRRMAADALRHYPLEVQAIVFECPQKHSVCPIVYKQAATCPENKAVPKSSARETGREK